MLRTIPAKNFSSMSFGKTCRIATRKCGQRQVSSSSKAQRNACAATVLGAGTVLDTAACSYGESTHSSSGLSYMNFLICVRGDALRALEALLDFRPAFNFPGVIVIASRAISHTRLSKSAMPILDMRQRTDSSWLHLELTVQFVLPQIRYLPIRNDLACRIPFAGSTGLPILRYSSWISKPDWQKSF